MRHWTRLWPALALLLTAGVVTDTTLAQKNKPLEPLKTWQGSVADESLATLAPKRGVVTDAETMKGIWEKWGVAKEVPEVDFDKQLLVVATTRGSRLSLRPTLSDDGDLRALAIATRDLRPGFRYQIALIPREGVKTVNGKALGK